MAEKKNTRHRDPNTTKTGKVKLHTKPVSALQEMMKNARPNMVPQIHNAILRKAAGRGR